jgi:hypothetical protein
LMLVMREIIIAGLHKAYDGRWCGTIRLYG